MGPAMYDVQWMPCVCPQIGILLTFRYHRSLPPSNNVLALQMLLLDEITVDLDVLARADFLKFLIEDCETRGMTIVYVSSSTYSFSCCQPLSSAFCSVLPQHCHLSIT